MNLIKWFRKNTKKLMAVIVVLLMFAFIAPQFFRQFQQTQRDLDEPVGFFGQNNEITRRQLAASAQRELSILRLKELGIVAFLQSQQDLRAFFLAELLFYEPRVAATVNSQLKANLQRTRLRMSPAQIDRFFEQRSRVAAPTELYWLLLKAEAAQAGITVQAPEAKRMLTMLIPQVTGGYTYKTVIESIGERMGVPEEDILQTFADLLAVLVYSQTITSNENVTTSQLMHTVRSNQEKLDIEFVQFDASVFAEDQPEPGRDEIIEHFEKYKKSLPGQITADNPYGFGYKLPEMVQLEYIAVRLDDAAELVKPPTEEEKEQYYQVNIRKFTYSEPLDPNDPDSEEIQRTKSYAGEAGAIARQLLQDRINIKAEAILNDAGRLTEAGLENVEIERIDSQEFKALAGDYTDAAGKVSEEYNIKVYTGKTGLLSAEDLGGDRRLGGLYLAGQGGTSVGLLRVAFALDELDPPPEGRLGLFEIPTPRMYENIGPMRETPVNETLVLARIIDAQKASEPDDIDRTYSKKTLQLDDKPSQSEQTYSVKEAVAEDVKLLKAMQVAETAAQEFAGLVQAEDWEKLSEQFNERYAARSDPNDDSPWPFRLQHLPGLQRISTLDLTIFRLFVAGIPGRQSLISDRERYKGLMDKLYSLLPSDKQTVENLPLVVEYRPYRSFYVIKSLSRKLISRGEYEKAKAGEAFTEDNIVAQSLAVLHFSPENIRKRMNYRPAGQRTQQPESGKPPKTAAGES